MPDNVQSARRQIEAHIALRTGNTSINGNGLGDCNNGSLLGADDLLITAQQIIAASSSTSSTPTAAAAAAAAAATTTTPELLASLYKNGLGSLFGYLDQTTNICNNNNNINHNINTNNNSVDNNNHQFVPMPSSTGSSQCDSASSTSSSSSSSSKSAIMTRPELINIWKSLGESMDFDEGLGDSPNIWSMPTTNILCNNASRMSPSSAQSTSPTDSLLANGNGGNVVGVGNSVNGIGMCQNILNSKRECLVCGDKEVTAALVPCGHNMFCLECANRICGTNDSACPICSQTVIQAIRIIA